MTSTFESYSKIGQIFSENIDDLIFIINDKHQCEYINFDDFASKKKINEFVHPDDSKRVDKLLKGIFKTGYGSEEAQIRYNGKPYRWFEIKGKSFIDNEDNGKKAFLICRDITKFKKFEFDFSSIVLERKLFDKSLAEKAVKSGAKLITETKVLGIEKNNGTTKVITNNETYEGKIIVGADGPISTIAGCMNMQKPELFPCVNYELAGDFEPVVEMYMGGVAPGGYAWVIPKKETANIGLGVQKKFVGKLNLKKLLDKFVGKLNLKKSIVNYSCGNVPCYSPAEKTEKKT